MNNTPQEAFGASRAFDRDEVEAKEVDINLGEGSFIERLQDSVLTLGAELTEPERRVKRMGKFTLGAIAEASALGRSMLWTLPYVFERVVTYASDNNLDGYEQAGMAAGFAGGIYGLWAWATGKAFKAAADELPKTAEAIAQNHPALVGVISKSISGFVEQESLATTTPEGGYEVGAYDARKGRIGKAALALTRGFKTLFIFGPVPYIGIAKTRDYSDKSIDRLAGTVSAEGAFVVGGLAAGLSTLITHDTYGVAEDIQDAITNPTYIGFATAGVVGYGALANYFSRRKFITSEAI